MGINDSAVIYRFDETANDPEFDFYDAAAKQENL